MDIFKLFRRKPEIIDSQTIFMVEKIIENFNNNRQEDKIHTFYSGDFYVNGVHFKTSTKNIKRIMDARNKCGYKLEVEARKKVLEQYGYENE